MCYKSRRKNKDILPGNKITIHINNNTPILAQFGYRNLNNKLMYNARSDNLFAYWKKLSRPDYRGYLEVDSFYEGKGRFKGLQDEILKLAIIRNPYMNMFLIVTHYAYPPIRHYHDRSPVIINNQEDEFLKQERPNFNLFKYPLKLAS